MKNNVKIKKSKDSKTLAKLYLEFDSYNRSNDNKTRVYSYRQYLKWAKISLSKNDKVTKLIYLNKLPVGYICYYEIVQEKDRYLDDIFITQEFRYKGIGKEVINILKKEVKKKKYTLSLEVYPWNIKALQFYKKLGFKEDTSIRLSI